MSGLAERLTTLMKTRREFVAGAALAGAAGLASGAVDIPRRPLGKTGLQVTILGLGGSQVGNLPTDKEAVDIVRAYYDQGVNYFDTATGGSYERSQSRYGIALKGIRDRIVLTSKTRQRTRRQVQADIELALKQLQTDRIDLMQIHSLYEQEDLDFLFGPRGVMEAFEKAKKDGLIRFLGVTCHADPALLARAIDMYAFDTVLMPLSISDGGYKQKSFEATTLPVAVKKGMGIVVMKPLGQGRLAAAGVGTAKQCLEYVWSLPVTTIIAGCDRVEFAAQNAALARGYTPMKPSAMEELRGRAQRVDMARLEPWKHTAGPNPVEPVYRGD
jgi:uncharacterized protein